MKYYILMISLFLSNGYLFTYCDAQPNVIFIIGDQMRGDAFGAGGNTKVNTPNLDRLASGGVMFENHFTNNPVCLPSRMSMFSGHYPGKTDVLSNSYPDKDRLAFEESLPWYFKQAGYNVGLIGKNHTYQNSELQYFDTEIIRDREEFRSYSKYVPPYWHSDIFWPKEDCNPAKNTNDAIQFIQANQTTPFFLTINYFNPHPPYMAPSEFTSKYCSESIELPRYIDPERLSSRLADHQKALRYDKVTSTDLKETMRYYYAAIEWGIDYQIGELLEALKELGIEENTIIVFTSDHGDFMGQHNMVRKAMFLYDALLHVPLIWYAPGRILGGKVVNGLSEGVDIFPTLLDLINVDIPTDLDGESLVPVLTEEDKIIPPDRKIFAQANYSELPKGYWNDPEPYFNSESDVPFHTRVQRLTWENVYMTRMVRTLNWKLILNDSSQPELYFMNGGTVEKENLYGTQYYSKKYEELKKYLE